MRRAFFFIGVFLFATTSFASIPRASMLDAAPSIADTLSQTRIRVSEVLAPFERPPESELTRALRQGYEQAGTTNASGLGRFLSVDPTWESADLTSPQSWNRYTYALNNPVRYTDPDGRMTPVPRMLTPEELEAQNEMTAVATTAAVGVTAKIVADYVLMDGSGMEGSTGDLPGKTPEQRAQYLEQLAKLDQPGGPKTGSSGGPGAGKKFSKETMDAARAESDSRCVFCTVETTRTRGPNQSNIDHAIAKSRGGNNTFANAQNACRTCNLRKMVKSTLEYFDSLIKKVF